MQVQLIDYTGAGHANPSQYAASLLAFTKSTRLEMDAGAWRAARRRPLEELEGELQYMARTIPSSWEFIHFTFLITKVSRAFTHQLVRTRTASFAQQAMRITDMQEWSADVGPSISGDESLAEIYDDALAKSNNAYRKLIASGAKVEDARGILPTNIHTNIVMSCNLRTLCDLARKRGSSRVQSEYSAVLAGILSEVRAAYTWADLFLSRDFDTAAKELDAKIAACGLSEKERTDLIKLVDQMRGAV